MWVTMVIKYKKATMRLHRNKFKIAAQSAAQQGDYVPPGLLSEGEIHTIPSC